MISRPTILRAAFLRFIPGVLTFLGGGLYLAARAKGIALGPQQMEGITGLTLAMTFGFVASLSVMRRALSSAAGVGGRRSLLAGLASPAVLLAFEMMPGSPVPRALNYGFAFLAGCLVALAMFVPWVLGRASRSGANVDVRDAVDDDTRSPLARVPHVATLAN